MTGNLIYKIRVGNVDVTIPMEFFETVPEIKKIVMWGSCKDPTYCGISKDPNMVCASLFRAMVEEIMRDGAVKVSIERATETE